MAIELIQTDARRAGRMMAPVDDVLPASGDDAIGSDDRSAATLVDLEASHGQALFGFVRRLGLSDDQADDCVQEVLLRLWAEAPDDEPRRLRAALRRGLPRRRASGGLGIGSPGSLTTPLVGSPNDDRPSRW